jgi:hypothetical protein
MAFLPMITTHVYPVDLTEIKMDSKTVTKHQVSDKQPGYQDTVDPVPPWLRKPRLRRWEASRYVEFVHGLVVAPATLAKLASIGGGPGFHKVGRIPLYPRGELDRWATEKLGRVISSTSDNILRPVD